MVVRPARRDDVSMITKIYNDAGLRSAASWNLEPVSLQDRRAWFGMKMARQWPVHNAAAIAFHETQGFVAVARLPEVGRMFDRRHDLVFLQRLLDEDQHSQDSA